MAGRADHFPAIAKDFGVVGAGIGAAVWLKREGYGEETKIG